MSTVEDLRETLSKIEEHDLDYEIRYGLVLRAMCLSYAAGFSTGIRMDPLVPEWPVVYIELPTGQVSWHMPQHNTTWDGHDTATKYARIRKWVDQ